MPIGKTSQQGNQSLLEEEVSVLSMVLSRIDEISLNAQTVSAKMDQIVGSIQSEVKALELNVERLNTKMDSVLRFIGNGYHDEIAKKCVELDVRLEHAEKEIAALNARLQKLHFAFLNSFLFPIFIACAALAISKFLGK